jgi:hypothetical protein
MKFTFLLLILLCSLLGSLLASCSKRHVDGLKYSLEEFDKLSTAATLSREKGEGELHFPDYGPGVNRLESKALVFERLAFFAVSFENSEQAKSEAVRLNQYYARNWLFDRVEGEPVLEDYVIETFKATNPNRMIQRVPKAHGEPHGKSEHHGAPAEAAGAHH